MATTRAAQAAVQRYEAKAYDKILVRVPKGRRDEIQAAAEAAGQSVNAYIVEAVDRRMQGHEHQKPPEDN